MTLHAQDDPGHSIDPRPLFLIVLLTVLAGLFLMIYLGDQNDWSGPRPSAYREVLDDVMPLDDDDAWSAEQRALEQLRDAEMEARHRDALRWAP
jgi:hypothetical protein